MLNAILALVAKVLGPLLALFGAYLKGKEAAKAETNVIVLETKVKNAETVKRVDKEVRKLTDAELIDDVYDP